MPLTKVAQHTHKFESLIDDTGERNGSWTAGQRLARGNGSTSSWVGFPFQARLLYATVTANTHSGGTLTAGISLNGTLQSAYRITLTDPQTIAFFDFSANPLFIPALTRWNWECITNTATGQDSYVVTTWLQAMLP